VCPGFPVPQGIVRTRKNRGGGEKEKKQTNVGKFKQRRLASSQFSPENHRGGKRVSSCGRKKKALPLEGKKQPFSTEGGKEKGQEKVSGNA